MATYQEIGSGVQGVRPEPTLDRAGLYMGREVATPEFVSAVDAASGLAYFEERDHFHVNIIRHWEAREQPALAGIPVSEAQAAIWEQVPSTRRTMSVGEDEVGIIRRGHNVSSIVIVDLDIESQELIVEEREAALRAVASLAPRGQRVAWEKFNKPGVVVGKLRPNNVGYERRTIRQRIDAQLPSRFILSRAQIGKN